MWVLLCGCTLGGVPIYVGGEMMGDFPPLLTILLYSFFFLNNLQL